MVDEMPVLGTGVRIADHHSRPPYLPSHTSVGPVGANSGLGVYRLIMYSCLALFIVYSNM